MTTQQDLSAKTAIVTGGASGIGAQLVAQLRSGGANVLSVDVDTEKLAAQAESTGCATALVDLATRSGNEAMVATALETFGQLDLAFLNAGILGRAITEQGTVPEVSGLDLDRYDAVRAINLDGVAYGTIACAKAMEASGGGAIVATASAAGLVPWPPDPFYTITKHGVVGWVRAISAALEPAGITIDAICPGGVATPLVGADDSGEAPAHLLSATQVAEAMLATALEPGSGRAVSVVAGREPVRQEHVFNEIPGFG